MSFNIQELLTKVGGADFLKTLGDKVGLEAERAQSLAADLLAHAKESGGDIMGSAQIIAEKTGLPLEQVQGVAAGPSTSLGAKAAELTGAAQTFVGDMLGKLKDTPLSGMVASLDKDGDGNPVNDLTDMAKNALGGLFGSKK